VVAKLERGGQVCDVGCGHGASTIIMAKAFPKSTFVGVDAHEPSVQCAAKSAQRAGVADRCRFVTSRANAFPIPEGGFDLVTFFDCLHDMGDPVGAARHARESIKPDGTAMIVEPAAADDVAGNLNPVGRVFSAASTMICVPASIKHRGPALGAVAGQARITSVLKEGGWGRVRMATATPFNMILEARP
jgi:ubiquinone/menaquinone biosynthesis C-methylase UbiE